MYFKIHVVHEALGINLYLTVLWKRFAVIYFPTTTTKTFRLCDKGRSPWHVARTQEKEESNISTGEKSLVANHASGMEGGRRDSDFQRIWDPSSERNKRY